MDKKEYIYHRFLQDIRMKLESMFLWNIDHIWITIYYLLIIIILYYYLLIIIYKLEHIVYI